MKRKAIHKHAERLFDIFEHAYQIIMCKDENVLLETTKDRVRSTPRLANPVCVAHGAPRQRHTCKYCAQEDINLLKTNPNLTPWDLASIMNILTRSYFCGVCVMEGKDDFIKRIRKAGTCLEHSTYNSQHTCMAHSKRWSACYECVHEFRAGTLRCPFCNQQYQRKCDCPRGPMAIRNAAVKCTEPQPEEQVSLKRRLVDHTIDYARKLQRAQNDELAAIVAERKVPEDAQTVRSVFETSQRLHGGHI